MTHWNFQGPELSSQLAVELHGHLGGDTHQGVLFTQSTLEDTLGGNWVVNTAELLDGVIAVLSVRYLPPPRLQFMLCCSKKLLGTPRCHSS